SRHQLRPARPRTPRAGSANRRGATHHSCRPTDHSLSRARPPRANISDSCKLAKHEGLQARASVRPRVGCSEKLGRASKLYQSCICDCSSQRLPKIELLLGDEPFRKRFAWIVSFPREENKTREVG